MPSASPFGMVSIRDCVHSGLCIIGMVSIRDRVFRYRVQDPKLIDKFEQQADFYLIK